MLTKAKLIELIESGALDAYLGGTMSDQDIFDAVKRKDGVSSGLDADKFKGNDTVPIANGGTGQTTAAAARNALGLGNTAGALPVANGGTGADNAATARTNLGAAPAAHNHDASDINTGVLATSRLPYKFAFGSVSMTIETGGTTVNAAIDYSAAGFSSSPVVIPVLATTAPSLFELSTSTPTTTGLNIYLYRASGTGTNTVKWFAFGL